MPGRRILTGGGALRWLAACAVAATVASPASAHAPPYGLAVLFPGSSSATTASPVVLTNRGLIVPLNDTFRLRCNNAYNAGTGEEPRGLADGPNRLVVRSYAGVYATEDLGCTFRRASPLTSDPIGAFAVAADGSRVLLSSLNYEAAATVLASEDAARSFDTVSTLPLGSVIDSLQIAPSDGRRVYAGGTRYDQVQTKIVFTWLVSKDGGTTFTAQDLGTRRTPIGVHPSNPEIVFASEVVDELIPETRVVRSVDGGLTFSTVLETTTVLALASTPDAARIWLGAGIGRDNTRRGGLFVSRDQGASFAPTLDQVNAATCLDVRGDRLWLCANLVPNVGGVWYSDDHGESLVEYFTFDDVTQEVPCSGDAADPDGGVCRMLWNDWVYEQTGAFPSDAGVMDAGLSPDAGVGTAEDAAGLPDATVQGAGDGGHVVADAADPGSSAPRKGGGGCSARGEHAQRDLASLLPSLLALGVFSSRRRRQAAAG